MGCDTAYCTCESSSSSVGLSTCDPIEDEWHPCLKQLTRCVVKFIDVSQDGGYHGGEPFTFEATNSCCVGDATTCPRITAGKKTGEGYELCGPPKHAEAQAAEMVRTRWPNGTPSGQGTAYLYGHTYVCGPCQEALTDVGVRLFAVTGEPA